jgi:hypothetical protein
MNVKQLRKYLKQFPDDLKVTVNDSHYGYNEVVDGEIIEAEKCEYNHNTDYFGDFQDVGEITIETLEYAYKSGYTDKMYEESDIKQLDILVLHSRQYTNDDELYEELREYKD